HRAIRSAQRIGRKTVGDAHALARQPIDMGRGDILSTVVAEFSGANLIREVEQHVWTGWRLSLKSRTKGRRLQYSTSRDVAHILIQTKHQQRMSGCDDHILLAVVHITDGVRVDIAPGLKSPQQIALFCVKRKEGALV